VTGDRATLTAAERECLGRYVGLLAERLGADLLAVRLFGSAARGDTCPEDSPMRSDMDLLVVTARELGDDEEEKLVAETYEPYLECGRQISPHFVSQDQIVKPDSDRIRGVLDRVRTEGVDVWPGPVTM
jgi:predicted nucleotidyltransferase